MIEFNVIEIVVNAFLNEKIKLHIVLININEKFIKKVKKMIKTIFDF